MPTLSPSRCQVSIPLEITGQDSELCGSDSSFVCENCGPICQGCADTFPCPLTSDGKHTPLQTQAPSPDIIFSIDEFRLRSGSDQGQMWLINNAFTPEWISGGNQTVLLSLDRYAELLLDAQLDGLSVAEIGGAQ